MKLLKIKYCDDCPYYTEHWDYSSFMCDKTKTKYETDDETYKPRDIPHDCPLEDAE